MRICQLGDISILIQGLNNDICVTYLWRNSDCVLRQSVCKNSLCLPQMLKPPKRDAPDVNGNGKMCQFDVDVTYGYSSASKNLTLIDNSKRQHCMWSARGWLQIPENVWNPLVNTLDAAPWRIIITVNSKLAVLCLGRFKPNVSDWST